MKLKRLCLVTVLLILQLCVSAQASSNVVVNLTPGKISTQPALPTQLNILTWNVHKGSDGLTWSRDLQKLSEHADLIALQEAMNDSFMPSELNQKTTQIFLMAQSFHYDDGSSTGVATGSKSQALGVSFSRSPGREPITSTPKMSLITAYELQNGKKLLVVNTHGINFVLNYELRLQLEKLKPIFKTWNGPIVFMGDFNTWNPWRTEDLKVFTSELGFTEVTFRSDSRILVLDHIFVKGCQILKSKVLDYIESSDHYPLVTQISCN